MTIQIHTIASIAYASEATGPDAPCVFTWSDGRAETHPASWSGFFRGVVGGRNSEGAECEWHDGTGMDTDATVAQCFGGEIAAYEPPPPPEEPDPEE